MTPTWLALLTIILCAAAPDVHRCLELDRERRAKLPKKSRRLEAQWIQDGCAAVPPSPTNIRRVGRSSVDAEMRRCDELQTALIYNECTRQEVDAEGGFVREYVDWEKCGVAGAGDVSAKDSWEAWGCAALVRPSPVALALQQRRRSNAGKSVNDLRVEEAERAAERARTHADETQELHDRVRTIQEESRRHAHGGLPGKGSMAEMARAEARAEAVEWLPTGNAEHFLKKGYSRMGFEAADDARPPKTPYDRRSGDL